MALLKYYKHKDGCGNFGDELSPFVVSKLSSNKFKTVYNVRNAHLHRYLIAIGSYIHQARNNDVIWGSGILNPNIGYHFKSLDVRAVRGPMTMQFLEAKGIKVPHIFGDPALLYPSLTQNIPVPVKTDKIGIVPHYVHLSYYKELNNSRYQLISPLENCHTVVEKIRSCSCIISSSLHGLIVADAYHIPNYWLTEHGLEHKHWKFHDYLTSQGRSLDSYNSIEAALESTSSIKYGNILDMESLRKAFPRDLIGK